MKHLVFVIVCLISVVASAQVDESALVKETIITFFDGFHKQDSSILKSVSHSEMTLRSISNDQAGNPQLTPATNFKAFVASIQSIPASQNFEERILDYQIAVNGAMALAWTPYEFYFNGTFSHCGVNNFTLFKNNGVWEVIAIVDTRTREGCNIN
ncbi:nuclear transport factor 2 family protein [Croceibacter atlanticus]|uniref:nuclear transport factor 2 family protein n=1 Tax=Croceibacter atlanticus TaxID=313588 RepID=UPI0030F85453